MKERGYSATLHQRCEYCVDALFGKQFYLFPCSHGFHSDCLLKRVFTHAHLDANKLATVRELEAQLKEHALRSKEIDSKKTLAQQEYLQNQLDGYIAADCPLCGFVMINSLAQPLLEPGREDDWKI